MKRSSDRRDGPTARPVTFRAAENLGALDLAQLWADRTAWPIEERTQYDELSELAVMSALSKWLSLWQPLAIHSAILAGARPEAVAGAFGDTVQAALECWNDWAVQQRDFILDGKPGITTEAYNAVARRFGALGTRLPG
jgi:hypothetical protein